MTKTAHQIQGDIYEMLLNSSLLENVSGDVYRKGYRPKDSQKEDVVVIFTAGIPDEVQTGVITVHIYVPDININGTGIYDEDGKRIEEVEALSQEWVDSLTADISCYKFQLQQTICSERALDIHQSFVVISLKYKYFDDNN